MKGMFAKSVRLNMAVGLLLVTPLVITVLVVNFLFNLATRWVDKFHGFMGPSADLDLRPLMWRFVALLFVLALLYVVGLFTRNVAGRALYRLGERLLTHIPVVNSVYIFVRQIIESVFRSRQSLFKEVVLIEYPRKGAYSIAFVTSALPEGLARQVSPQPGPSEEGVCVFVPTTPNPTSGVLLLLPRSQTYPVSIGVMDGMKLVMSGGAFIGGGAEEPGHSLLDLLQVSGLPAAGGRERKP